MSGQATGLSPGLDIPAQAGAGAAAAPADTLAADAGRPGHEVAIRVYYEDTDAAGVVYHANYLRFAERGRTEMLRRLGFGQRRLREESGIGFVVRRCTIDFLAPARLDDALTVASRVVDAGAATLAVRQEIRRAGEVLVALDVLVACVGRDGRPRRLPGIVRSALGNPAIATPMSK